MRRILVLPVAAVALTAAVAVGCGSGGGSKAGTGGTAGGSTSGAAPHATESNPPGDIPDNQAYVLYRPSGGGFTVKVPEGWARTAKGTAVTYTDKLNRIEVAPATASAAPTTASVTANEVPVLRKQVPTFALGKVTTVSRPAGTAVLVTYQGDSAPDPVTGKVVRDAFERYVFHHNGRQVDLTLSGPVSADNVDPWRIVSSSLRWQ